MGAALDGYSETHGSEGDPAIPNAWKYRDYLIRALNADVPYDQLLREHIAGDLLANPRINEELGVNESAIGPAHWRMCFHGFAPTDALDEKVRFTDDQINVFSKAFLGLTVSCARCHNHKFDPISQADYYAIFGILGSTRPGIIDANPTSKQLAVRAELKQLKAQIRDSIANNWLASTSGLADRLDGLLSSKNSPNDSAFLAPLRALQQDAATFNKLVQESQNPGQFNLPTGSFVWDLTSQADFEKWYTHGNGTANEVAEAGEFALQDGGKTLSPLLAGGVYSPLRSNRRPNVFSSPQFDLDGEFDLWIQVAGNGQSLLRYVVQNYPRNGTVYPATNLSDGKWRWQKYDLTYWDGDRIHVEVSTAADSAVLAKNVERSWFGVRKVVLAPKGTFQPPDEPKPYDALFHDDENSKSETVESLAAKYESTLREAILAWKQNKASEAQVRFIENCRTLNLLSTSETEDERLKQLLSSYQNLEATVAVPNRIPGLLEADAADQAMMIRGNHKQTGASVPRRFLEAIDDTPYETELSGRLQLAEDLTRVDNPLTSRVAVNRIWHSLFGAGLVRTVDNFGQLGEKPSHSELLDHLAIQFRNNGWSMKSLVRETVLTKTWQLKSTPSEKAQEIDPENRLLSHANLRRLQAEELRDSILTLTGKRDRTMFGPPVGNATETPRRSLYLSVRRNSLNPFLKTFDFPVPFATKGRRDSTNVPAQSLTLLNDSFVISSANRFAKRVLASKQSEQGSVQKMYLETLGRLPSRSELNSASLYLKRSRTRYQEDMALRRQIEETIEANSNVVSSILVPVRKRLSDMKETGTSESTPVVPSIAEWTFDKDFQDSIGSLHGEPKGEARIEEGALVLNGRSHVSTAPLQIDLKSKTLEAIVQLSNLDQRGGGIMTVQDLSGTYFDAIVIGEQQARYWLAGSNNFARTLPFNGTAETEAVEQPVHLAITYDEDGTIQAFRNGAPYGKPYRKSGVYSFQESQAQVLFGLRHGSPGGNRMLNGKILEARLYNRALKPEEVQAIATGKTSFVSEREVMAALTAEDREKVLNAQNRLQQLQAELAQQGKAPEPDQEWTDLAHALFNLKEFLYVQ